MMTCWYCHRVMSIVDVKEIHRKDFKRETFYKCSNCGASFLVTEHAFDGPLKKFNKEKSNGRPKNSI